MRGARTVLLRNVIMPDTPPLWDALIVGGGPAGLSAAIYLGRSHRRTLVVHSAHSMAKWEQDVQNYLGFPDGIDGQDLLTRGLAQARRYQVEVLEDTIQSIRPTGAHFELRTVRSGCYSPPASRTYPPTWRECANA